MAVLDDLAEIHKRVHDKITFVQDHLNPEHPGIFERWNGPRVGGKPAEEWDGETPFYGDCDDFATACKILAERAGIPLNLVACYVPADPIRGGASGNHLVAAYRDWIVDNLQPPGVIVNKKDLDYRWQAISTDGLGWREIVGA